METILFQTRGYILKEEKVRSLQQSVLADTLVLENYQPLPGYFGENLPDNASPRSIFIILARRYDLVWVGRRLKKISAMVKHSCYGTIGEIIIGNRQLFTIRIKNLSCFEDISRIQSYLLAEGMELMHHQMINGQALIEIHKTFFLKRIKYDIYQDTFESSRYYLPLEEDIDWDAFRKITQAVKNNTKNNRFDAAQGMIWTLNGPQELVRIYDDRATIEQLNELRLMYEYQTHQFMALNPVRELEDSHYFY